MPSTILVVDNEPRTSALIRSLATPLGYSIAPFDDYEAAGKKGEAQRFEVVFVGMKPDHPEGLEFVRRIRNSELNRRTFIVMLSASDDIRNLRDAFGEGADLYLVKPVKGDHVHRMLVALPEWKEKRHAVRLPLFTDVTCTWNDRRFALSSLNISEKGMLLRPSPDIEIGQEVLLEFKIAECRASLSVFARIVRKERSECVGVAFVGLAPEDINAINVYVTGHLKDLSKPAREFLSKTRPHRLFDS